MRPRQVIMLGLLLLVPVLAFLFLYGFGTNRFALPYYLPERLADASPEAKPTPGRPVGQRDTVFHRVRPWRLRGAAGETVGSAEVGRGAYVVHFFEADEAGGRLARELARVQEKFRRDGRVRLVSVVPGGGEEPAGAAPELLRQLSERYGTVSGRWYFLSGPADTLRRLARFEFGATALRPNHLPFRPDTEPATLPAGRLLLVDRAGHVRGYYEGHDSREIDRLMTEISVLMYTYDHEH